MEYKFLDEATDEVIKHQKQRTELIMQVAASRLRGDLPFDEIADQLEMYLRAFSPVNNKED